MVRPPLSPDWRCPEHYAALAKVGRSGFAWEWLRRKPIYRTAYEIGARRGNADHLAQPFGLHRLEPPQQAAPLARPIWRAEADPHVLLATAYPDYSTDHDAFDVCPLKRYATCHHCPKGHERWLFSDGYRAIRLDLVAGSLAFGAVGLDYHINGLTTALPRLVALYRLIALARTGQLPAPLFRPERKAPRWILVLRTADALAAGASQRDIAEHLLGLETGQRWRVSNPSYRRRAQRLVEAAKRAMNTDPCRWLCGDVP